MANDNQIHDDWTIRTLKELSDERQRHYHELRQADKELQQSIIKNIETHLTQLNENAKRTIEERGHFLAVEAFDPFKDTVLKFISHSTGNAEGQQITMGKIYTALMAFGAILGIIIIAADRFIN